MSKCLNQFLGIACLTMSLQIGSSTKATAQTSPQDKTDKSSNTSSSSANSIPSERLALVSDSPESKSKSDVKTEAGTERATSAPKVGLKNPSIDLKVVPRESRISERNFAGPDLETMGEPRVFRATAYALYGRTRSGVYVRRGVIAADPRVLPLGSVVQIKAGKYTGVYTVQDTGKVIKGNIVDLWVPTNREARQFGRQRIKLHVLRLGAKSRVKPAK